MKNILALCWLLASNLLFGQGSINFTIQLMANNGSPYSGVKVCLKESSGLGKIDLVTNQEGKAGTTLTLGKEWNIYLNGYQSKKTIEVPENGYAEKSMKETFDPVLFKRLDQQVYSRNGFTLANSEFIPGQRPPEGYNVLAVLVVDRNNRPQTDEEVGLVSLEEKMKWTMRTDNRGYAWFWAKRGKSYDVDVSTALNLGFTEVPDIEDIEITETIQFQKVKFDEVRKNDTIVQTLYGETEPPSGYQYFKLVVLKNHENAPDEPVYLWDVKGQEVYLGKTNEEGVAEFMLPIKRKYMVDFEYQKDVDVVDLSGSFGRSTREMRLIYIPNPKLEHPELFIPKPEELFIKDFQAFTKKQYPKPITKIGIHHQWGGKVNARSKEAVLEIGFNTNYTASHNYVAPRLNVSFVIDNSGSMAGYERIEHLKDALIKMVPKLPQDATVSFITYNSITTVILNPQTLGKDQLTIAGLINEIQPGGGTNMLEGMQKAYSFVEKNYDPKALNKLILLTDGWDENEVLVLENAQKQFPLIECSTVGVGPDFNYALLTILANNGKGKLFYVNSGESFDSVFAGGMVTNMTAVATDVTVEVEFNEKIVLKHLYGYKPVAEGANPAVYRLPNLYDESCEFALAKFDLVSPDSTIENQPVTIKIKFTNPETKQVETMVEKVYLDWEPYTGEIDLIADAENKKLYAMAILNQSFKVMADYYAAGKNTEAKQTLERASEQVVQLYPQAKDKDVNDLLTSLDGYLEAFKNLAKKNGVR
jgi:uncharacterized protein YegL